MYPKYNTGPITLDKEGYAELFTPEIQGEIVKVAVFYSEVAAEEMHLQIYTNDGERIMNIQGAEDGLWYPRNWNVQNQQYTSETMAVENAGVMNAEKFVTSGPLKIMVKGSPLVGDQIDNIMFLIKGDIVYDFEKEDAPVTTTTPGVYNPSYSRRGKRLKDFVAKIMGDITKDSQEIAKLNRADEKDLRGFIEDSLYSYSFDGINKSVSEQIKDFILKATLKGYPQERVLNYIQNKGATLGQAKNIFRTESHALRTKVREWSYDKLDPEDEFKYKWLGPDDNRRTPICEAITKRTRNGMSMAQLKQVINEEVDKAKRRGELPTGYDAREFTPHFQCRHTFIRAF